MGSAACQIGSVSIGLILTPFRPSDLALYFASLSNFGSRLLASSGWLDFGSSLLTAIVEKLQQGEKKILN